MDQNSNVNLIENFLEGLDEYKPEFFFPYDKILKDDIKEKLKQKDPEFIEKYQKLFPFPLLEETKETQTEPELDLQTPDIDIEAQQDLQTPDIDFDTQQDLQTPDIDFDTQQDLQTPDIDFDTQQDLQTPDIDFDTQQDLQTPDIDFDTQQDLQTPDIDFDTQQDLQTPDIDFDTQQDLQTPDIDFDTQQDLQTPDIDFDTQQDLQTPDIDFEAQQDLQTPDIDFDTQQDLQTPDIDFNTQQDLQTPDIDFNTQQDLQTPDIDFEAQQDLQTPELSLESPDTTSEQKDTFDLGDISIDESELKQMKEQALLSEGIGAELSDKELAQLRQSLLSYSEPVRKAIIDAIVNEKISRPEQRILLNMLIDEAEEANILDFIEEKLGYRPKVSIEKTKEGIPIIYTEDVSPEALKRKRQRTTILLFSSISLIVGSILFLLGIRFYHYYSTKNLYEQGLKILEQANSLPISEREKAITEAENYFENALSKEGEFNVKYLNLYGNAYIKLGKFDQAFEKLFGKIQPDYLWNSPQQRVPLINKITSWRNYNEIRQGYYTEFSSNDNVKRTLLMPGGYTVTRLRDGTFDKENIINLAKFHSLNFPYFLESEEGKKYKNDELAIDYYKIILTLMNKPNDPEAIYGIGQIYYNQKKFSKATNEFQKIIDQNPDNILGHDGILNTYIEVWKENKDPRYVIAKHRYLQQINLEKKLPIYTLAKLAGFYVDINPETLRIKYNVDPVNTINQLDINTTTEYLLDLIYHKKEERDGIEIEGKKYGEGFYQRGRYYFKIKQFQNGVKQFQNAYYFDPKHFPAILHIGEYYLYKLKDYDKAKDYFLEALKVYLKEKDFYGIRPEDETLISFNKGLIYYNIVSVIFEKHKKEFIPPITSLSEPNESYQNLLKEFDSTEEYNLKAIELLEDQDKTNISLYRQGFIDYIHGNYDDAIKNWLSIRETEDLYKSPIYYIALGNVSFKKEQYNQALDYFKQSEKILEEQKKLKDIYNHILYYTYNNIGATYEALYYKNMNKIPKYKLDELKQKSMSYYYKALEFGNQNKIIPVKSKINLDLSFKREKNQIELEDSLLPELFFDVKDFQ
jgi:tetratricopeptide (TPR) repeat protein